MRGSSRRSRLLLALAAAGSLAAICGGMGAARPTSSEALDVEFAFDATGSMAPLIAQAKKDSEAIMDAVSTFDANAHFAVAAFRDKYYPAPEYEVLTPFTADRTAVRKALGRIRVVSTNDPRNVSSEAYNLAFQRSFADASLGWRASSRKVVVVVGDGEPHGAGAAGLPGCANANEDRHGLNTARVLAEMKAAKRTLLLIRQSRAGGASLDCYGSMAALAYAGSAARDAGSGDLVGPIRALIEGTLTPLTLSSDLPLALPATKRTLTLRVVNVRQTPVTLNSLVLTLPAGFRFRGTVGGKRPPTAAGPRLTWQLGESLMPAAGIVVRVRVDVGTRTGLRPVTAGLTATLADARPITATAWARIKVTSRLAIRASRPGVHATATLAYAKGRSALLGRVPADGRITAGTRATRLDLRVTEARARVFGPVTRVTLRARVEKSARATCRAGSTVELQLTDRDLVQATSIPDAVAVTTRGCRIAPAPADVRIG